MQNLQVLIIIKKILKFFLHSFVIFVAVHQSNLFLVNSGITFLFQFAVNIVFGRGNLKIKYLYQCYKYEINLIVNIQNLNYKLEKYSVDIHQLDYFKLTW